MLPGLAWVVFGILFGVLAAQKKGFSVLAGALGGALLGILSPLLLFVSGSGAEVSARSGGAQLGRGILIAFGLVAALLAVAFVAGRMGAFR